jgi:hypothetical protein
VGASQTNRFFSKKRLIITDPLEDATLLGITSALKAYKLAWLINHTTTLQLASVADLHFEVPVRTTKCTAHFLFETEYCTSRLIKNMVVEDEGKSVGYLIPSLKHIDLFFAARDFTQTFNADAFFSALKTTKRIAYIARLDLETYKNQVHLLFH